MRLRSAWSCILLLCCAGCGHSTSAVTSIAASTRGSGVVDDWGRPVLLHGAAHRVVCIGPGATETVFALGAGDRLVGRDQVSDYPPPALRVAVVGNFAGPFLEATIAARPDLVVVQGETYGRARLDDWQAKMGVPVAGLNANTVAGVARDVEKIDDWLGTRRAAPLVATLLRPVKTRTDALAFFEVQRSPLWAGGSHTLIDDVMRRAGLRNAAAAMTGYKPYSLESLIAAPPQLYIVTATPPDRQLALRQLRAQPVLKELPCVRAGRVAVVADSLVLRPGPRLAQGIAELARQAALLFPAASAGKLKTGAS